MISAQRTSRLAAGILVLASLAGGARAAEPTPEQIQMFMQLPPEQRAELMRRAGVSGAPVAAPADAPLPQPAVAAPKPPPSAPAPVETIIREGQDAPTLKETAEPLATPAKLRLFGYDLFREVPTTFAPATDIPVPADYVLGPGDTIRVQMFGKEGGEYNLVVSREGLIKFPNIGPVAVAGLRYPEMEQRLNKIVSEQMIGMKASISMGPLRSIQVFVVGDAARPGAYTLSALSTITHALFVSGGVREVGSLRDIQLKRGGRIIKRFDLYSLLLEGDTGDDLRLQPGDALFIPPIGPVVGVAGEVRRPAIYELKSEKTAADLVRMAGGFLPTAYPKASQVERIEAAGARTIVDVDLSNPGAAPLPVRDGDVIRIYSILDKMENVVLLSGHVQRPGGYQWRPGMRLADLLPGVPDLLPKPDLRYVVVKREIQPRRLIEAFSARLDHALADPSSPANIELQPRDEVFAFGITDDRVGRIAGVIDQLRAQSSFGDPPKIVSVQGHVQFPGAYPLDPGMRVSDLIRAALDLKPQADLRYAVLRREQPNGQVDILPIGIGQVLEAPGSDADEPLRAKDSLLVFRAGVGDDRAGRVGEIVDRLKQQSSFEAPARIVSVAGSVFLPGTYPLEPGMRVSHLVRASLDILPQTDLHYSLLRRERSNGFVEVVPVDLKSALQAPGEAGDLALQPKDTLLVFGEFGDRQALVTPVLEELRRQATAARLSPEVSLTGSMRHVGAFPLVPGMKASDLLRAGGAFTQAAYTLGAEVTRYNIVDGKIVEVDHAPVDLRAIEQGDAGADLALAPFDRLAIKQIEDWRQTESVELEGEVRFPGSYVIRKGETVRQLLERAGGLTDQAYPFGAVFTREELRKREQAQIDRMKDSLRADLAATSLQELNADPEKQQAVAAARGLLTQLESAKAAGRLALDLPNLLEDEDEEDVALRPGDRIFIPRKPQEVTVIGEVNYPTSHLWRDGYSRDEYVNLSGGTTYKADKSRTYVVRANGEVSAGGGFWARRRDLEPGDTVVVPLDVDRVRPLAIWQSISQITYQLALSAAAFKTIGAF